jgi:hypothetical protein
MDVTVSRTHVTHGSIVFMRISCGDGAASVTPRANDVEDTPAEATVGGEASLG